MAAFAAGIYKRLYEGLNYRARSFAGGRWASRCRPVSIVFLLTELCNARCIHCDIWKNRGREDTPTVEQWKAVLADLRRWLGRVQVAFSGGEALLRPFTSELIAHAAELGLFAECLTHGYWDDQSTIERLAMARPWRVTVSVDGVGETHTQIRGRNLFWEKTSTTLQTFQRIRREHRTEFAIRLKTVIMEQNLHDVANVARFAHEGGMEVFYQPIEQNYNTLEDTRWFEHSATWPKNTSQAIAVVKQLIQLKHSGLPIANSVQQLEAMIPYFQNPGSLRVSTQAHHAHEGRAVCAALTTLQFQPNGDVKVCTGMPPVGNVKATPIREIWECRPCWWRSGCCIERRCTDDEKRELLQRASL